MMINPRTLMTGPYIASLLSIPVLHETVVKKGVAVSKKKSGTCQFILPYL